MSSAKQSPTPHPTRTVPIPDTLDSIKGYPDKLKIYRMAASSFWQVRFFDGKSTIKRSTGQTDKREAIKSAISFYEKLLINKHNGVAGGSVLGRRQHSWDAKAVIEAQYGGSFASWWRGPTQVS